MALGSALSLLQTDNEAAVQMKGLGHRLARGPAAGWDTGSGVFPYYLGPAGLQRWLQRSLLCLGVPDRRPCTLDMDIPVLTEGSGRSGSEEGPQSGFLGRA